MSALVTALDKESNLRTGENGHIEHGINTGYSNEDIRERIVQFYFQLVRNADINTITNELDSLLKLTWIKENDKNVVNREFVITLYKILVQTRDIVAGKGEYKLAYSQLTVWWKYYPALAKYALYMFAVSYTHLTLPTILLV